MSENPVAKKPSAAWYLMPIFLGLIGGLIMYFVLKDENRDMAKKGIILGFILTVISAILGSLIMLMALPGSMMI